MKHDLTGLVFGRLTALQPGKSGKHSTWICVCICGRQTEARTHCLLVGNRKSCGCSQAPSPNRKVKHGHARGARSAEYRIWGGMKTRCAGPGGKRNANYGAAGVSVCERWQVFENFLADMGPRPSSKHSIDRIDPKGHYEPSNCRWATPSQQSRNTRLTVLVEHQGRQVSIWDLADELGLNARLIAKRLRAGWPAEAAIFEPSRPGPRPFSARRERRGESSIKAPPVSALSKTARGYVKRKISSRGFK